MEHELFVCMCGDPSHQFVVSKFIPDEGEDITDDDWDLFISVKLNRDYNIFRRIWIAFKYVFSMSCKYGDFNEVILNKSGREKLIKTLSELK